MATIAKQAIEIAKTLSGGPPAILTFGEAATQSFKAGEVVYLVNGLVTLYSAAGTKILGIAMKDASGVTSDSVPVALACDDTIFCANLSGSLTTTIATIGIAYPLAAASNKWHVNTATTTSGNALIVGLDGRDAVSDVAGRVHFIFLGKWRQLDTTS